MFTARIDAQKVILKINQPPFGQKSWELLYFLTKKNISYVAKLNTDLRKIDKMEQFNYYEGNS